MLAIEADKGLRQVVEEVDSVGDVHRGDDQWLPPPWQDLFELS